MSCAIRRGVAAIAVLLLPSCDSSITDEPPDGGGPPIELGVNLPTSGEFADFGQAFAAAVELAVTEVNTRGGVAGRSVELVVRDNGSEPLQAAQHTSELGARAQLAAMVGPALSVSVEAALPAIKAAELVTISGSSTAASLADADDGGFLFRNVSNNDHQAAVIAHYVHDTAASPDVVIAHEPDQHCSRLRDQVTAELTARGGQVLGTVTLPAELAPGPDADAAWADIAALLPASPPKPTAVVCAYLGVAEHLVTAWHQSGEHADLPWLLSDAVRPQALADALPATVTGIRGAAPTLAPGAAADAFAAAYGPTFKDYVFEAMFYDATYLTALGLHAQLQGQAGDALGGAPLGDALMQVAGPPGEPFHASEWPAALAAIEASRDVDYEGASGPCDFDARGEAPGPYEIWEIASGAVTQQAVIMPDEL